MIASARVALPRCMRALPPRPRLPPGSPCDSSSLLLLHPRDVVITAHHATIRLWDPFTGRMLTQLPFGFSIEVMAVHSSAYGTVQVAVDGPGPLLTELHEGPASGPPLRTRERLSRRGPHHAWSGRCRLGGGGRRC